MSPTSPAPAVTPAGPPVAAKPSRHQPHASGGERFHRELATATAAADSDSAPGAGADCVVQPDAPQPPTAEATTAITGDASLAAAGAISVALVAPTALPVAAPVAVGSGGPAAPAGGAATSTSVPATAGALATATVGSAASAPAAGVTTTPAQTSDADPGVTPAADGHVSSAEPKVRAGRRADVVGTGKASAAPTDPAPPAARVPVDDVPAGPSGSILATAPTAGPAQRDGAEQVTPPAALTSATTSASPAPAPALATSQALGTTSPSATPSIAVPVTPQLLTAQLGPRALAAAVAATASGLHTINVQLRPAQLGTIQVVATLGDQGLTLHLHAATDATREVLRSALSDLRADLSAGGITDLAGLDVSDRAPDQQSSWGGSREERSPSHAGGGSATTTGSILDIPAVPTLLPSRDSRRVDLRV